MEQDEWSDYNTGFDEGYTEGYEAGKCSAGMYTQEEVEEQLAIAREVARKEGFDAGLAAAAEHYQTVSVKGKQHDLKRYDDKDLTFG